MHTEQVNEWCLMKKSYLLIIDIIFFIMVIISFFKDLLFGFGALCIYILFVIVALREFLDANRDKLK